MRKQLEREIVNGSIGKGLSKGIIRETGIGNRHYAMEQVKEQAK